MKPRKSEAYRESRYSKIRGQRARGGQSGRIIVEASRDQFIAYLAVKLMMQWFGCSAIQPDHFKSEYRMATSLPMKIWRWMFGVGRLALSSDHEQEHERERE